MVFLEALERWFLLWELSFNLNKCHALNCNLCYHSSKLLLLSCSLCLASHFLLLWVAVAQEMSFTSEYWSLCVWSVWCTVSPAWLVPWFCSWAELQYNYQALHKFSIVLLFNQFNQSSPPMRGVLLIQEIIQSPTFAAKDFWKWQMELCQDSCSLDTLVC